MSAPQRPEEIEKDETIYCDICEITLSNRKTFKKHQSSENHMKKLDQMRSLCSSSSKASCGDSSDEDELDLSDSSSCDDDSSCDGNEVSKNSYHQWTPFDKTRLDFMEFVRVLPRDKARTFITFLRDNIVCF